MIVTDWIRAAVSGLTADGRELPEPTLEELAAGYSPDFYTAHIFPEHIRGVDPTGMFKSLGDVMEVKTERIKGGALAGKLALYVKIAPHPDLIAMVRSGQKVHLSLEIEPSFADTGKSYLVGLGVTDSPASLGTGIMKFSASQRNKNLFTNPLQAEIKELVTANNDYSLQFTQLQSQNTALLQQFTAMSAELSKLLAEVGNLKASIKETHTIVEEIGNASSGRFRPYTRNKFASDSSSSDSQKVDY
jgi:hypothetical protein